MSLTVAEFAVESLVANGIDSVFCLPGLQLDPFLDAVYGRQDRIRAVHTRHEQGAAYMATGAALATGTPQAYAVVAGSGFLNSSAALSTALSVNARVMALVGDIPVAAQGRGFGVLHEIPDLQGIMERLTKATFQVSGGAAANSTIGSAWKELISGAPGPVGQSIPMDLWNADTGIDEVAATAHDPETWVDSDAVADAVRLIAAAKAPMVVVGGGAQDVSEEITRISDVIGAPVVAFRNGHGVVSAENPMRITMPVAHALWPKVDLVIGLGTRLQTQLMDWGFDENLKTVHVTLNADDLGRVTEPTVGINADLADVLPLILSELEGREVPNADWRETVLSEKAKVGRRIEDRLSAQFAWLAAIRAEIPRDGILVDEITQMGYVGRFGYPVYQPRTLITPGYQATLGYGYATALGVAYSRRDVPVVNFCGDGGALFTLSEIATGVQHGISLTTIIFADGHYGNVRGLQRDRYQGRYIATELSNPDFVKFAESFGAQGLRAETPEELRTRLKEGMRHAGPTVIEVPVGEFNSPWEFILLPWNRGL